MKKLILLLLLICGSFSVFAAEKPDSFAYQPVWLSLVHYQKHWYGYRATLGSADFYLSPNGKNNPEDELQATIALFNSGDDQKKCFFPARYLILKKYGLMSAPFPNCSEFDQFKHDLRPSGVTLLFTDAYMNNSSSLFGHTLLRIDTARAGTQLLAHGINYGANAIGYENSFLYAFYGLTGGYSGSFTTKPYYDVINTYNNIENRDIWEYSLNLTPVELDLLVAHVWEVGHTMTPYYFFSLNCSYMLMEVLDAVRPELKLSKQFKYQTIPLDTVKAAAARDGFVKSVKYRPSRQKKINHRLRQMNTLQKKAFLQMAEKINNLKTSQNGLSFFKASKDLKKTVNYKKSPLMNLVPKSAAPSQTNTSSPNSPIFIFPDRLKAKAELNREEKADVLETAYQYLQYCYVAGDLGLAEYRQAGFELLRKRNQLSAGQKFNDLSQGDNPVDSHNSQQISFGVGSQNGHWFQQMIWRPAYHSLIDKPQGYLSGAEINFLETYFRHYDRHDRYVFEKLNILQLSSFSPIDEVFQAVSYRIELGLERWINPQTNRSGYVSKVSAGGGGTLALTQNIWLYGLGSLDGAYGGALPHNQWSGVGAAAGALVQFKKFGAQLEAKKVFASAKSGKTLQWKIKADYYLNRNLAFGIDFSHTTQPGHNLDETLVLIKRFF